ncbi:MAG: hypothetical protein QOJ62_262 [Actinomycetota bacterium]|nr:hypothetical protein [Actinomycetota bacterium]
MTSSATTTAGKRRRSDHPLARLLLDSIDDEIRGTVPLSAYGDVNAADVETASFIHKVTPAVYLHLRGSGDAPPEMVEPLMRRYQGQVARHLQVLADLAALAKTLDGTDISWAVMKGPVLAERLWSRPDLRMYYDLDILVDRRRFGDVLELLVATGSKLLEQNWPLIQQRVRAEVSLQLPNGAALDLHWHAVNDRRQRSQFTFPIAEMLARSVKVEVGASTVPTLDPSDTLLHLAYHTAHSGGHCLMWLKDIERATADPDLDWAQTLRRARAYGLALPLAMVLVRTARVIGFEFAPPAAAFAPARRSAWGVLATAVDTWRPPPMLPHDKHPAQMPFKNVRSSTLASLRPTLSWVRERRIPAIDPREAKKHVEGGDAARAAYLVALQGPREP